jgi:hypothetical protein
MADMDEASAAEFVAYMLARLFRTKSVQYLAYLRN